MQMVFSTVYSNILILWLSAAKCEPHKSSVSEDIDALLEELLEDDYDSSPQSKVGLCLYVCKIFVTEVLRESF